MYRINVPVCTELKKDSQFKYRITDLEFGTKYQLLKSESAVISGRSNSVLEQQNAHECLCSTPLVMELSEVAFYFLLQSIRPK